ncbi:hypothetical protein PRK78_005040 [Emydomyces testavorans]|uniref:Uncharacterized protein n=1 Tax=Emydomyces testavorans TaxID=2070801 RepID=A0AAF0DIY2_9EURO|nr:hypothetical protein PRK78_005040 [Emydomyces testavorans]
MPYLESFCVGIVYRQPQQSFRSLVFCDYLGNEKVEESCISRELGAAHGPLTTSYSRFCPERTRKIGQEYSIVSTSAHEEKKDERLAGHARTVAPRPLVKWHTSLDEFEPFSQLCVDAHLFWRQDDIEWMASQAQIEGGTVRLWREWLDDQLDTRIFHESANDTDLASTGELGTKTSEGSNTTYLIDSKRGKHRILWVGRNEDVGLKLRVIERSQYNTSGDSSSYELSFEGE